ncbi:CorA metal ion transporter, partial [Linderina pennispora]
MGKKRGGRSSKASKASGTSGQRTKNALSERRATASQALQACVEPRISPDNKAMPPGSPTSSRHRLFLERAVSEHRVQDMLRRPSASSALSRASENSNIANVLSHYMHEFENDDENGLMASRYYGNMADLPENADRPLMPMNSTLPLFSPSVANRRKIHRVKTTGSSGTGSNGGIRGRINRAATDVHPRVEAVDQRNGSPMSEPMSEPGDLREWSAPLDGGVGKEPGNAVDTSRPQSIGSGGQPDGTVATIPESPVADVVRTPSEGSGSQTASQGGKQPESEHSQDLSETLPMVPSRLLGIGEKDDGLGLSTTEHQQRPRRSINTMGATQYKPAASSKRTAMARAAPGLSYMFSPALNSSRPSSVIGGSVPGVQNMGEQSEGVLRRGSVGQNPLAGLPKEETGSEDKRMDGGINIAALERFLQTGEIPESTSEEDDDETASDYSWGEYSEPESVFNEYTADGAGLAQKEAAKAAEESKAVYTMPGSFKSMVNQSLRPTCAANRASISSEREPLLQRAVTMSPHYNLTSPSFVPADLPPIDEPPQRARVSPPDRNHRSFDGRPLEKQKQKRRRRKRMHQEELFLDKDGFIDESYRFTFFNPAIGTVRSQELADLRTPAMDLASMIQAGGCFWIDVLRPSFQEMHLISKIFGIHALTVEDIMTQDV